ncbi:Transmembrane domain-containing protein [Spironucleus salmonicida]|uniref:Transmembrane domain-containing protein n=1 Tax=Spironucleus salmonicida TaxID=348837 RepID=V6LEM0_9EUKA|nr:Transmembrane domain-containing protein [Spironucleus salmonicida]|eukprot:EST42965.1 Transmembrane domain-containing protein [Spironucleus salmonicida]
MILSHALIVLYTAVDFTKLNNVQNENFVLNNNITLNILNQPLIDQFVGSLSGARNTLKITEIQPGGSLFQQFGGSFSSVSVIVEFEIGYSIVLAQELRGAQLRDAAFRIQSDGVRNAPEITFFSEITDATLGRCVFTIVCNAAPSTSYRIFGIAFSINKLHTEGLEVHIIAKNAFQVAGLCRQLGATFPALVTLGGQEIEEVFGIALASSQPLNALIVRIVIRGMRLVCGIARDVCGVENSQILLIFTLKEGTTVIYGVARSIEGPLHELQLQIGGIFRSNMPAELAFLGGDLGAKTTISHVAILAEFSLTGGALKMALLASGSALGAEVRFLAMNASIEAEHSALQPIYCFSAAVQDVIIEMLAMNFSLQGSISGDFGGFGIAPSLVGCKFTNFTINFALRISEISGTLTYCALGIYVEEIRINNASFYNYVLISSAANAIGSTIFGLAKQLVRSDLNYVIVQNQIQVRYASIQAFAGLADQLMDVTINILVLCGTVNLQNQGQICGIARMGRKSYFVSLMINFHIESSNNAECILFFDICDSNQFINIVEQANNMRCLNDVKYIITDTKNNKVNYFAMQGSGKERILQTISRAQMKAGAEVNELLKTDKWEVDSKNDGLVRLKNFFSVKSTQFAEEANPEIQPFTQQQTTAFLYINIKNQENLCFDNCQGTFDGKQLVCKQGYTGVGCEEFECKVDFCQDGATCNRVHGCECVSGKGGVQCEIDLCPFCLGGYSNCDTKFSFPVCINDQTTTCHHGIVVNNFCACSDGYTSVSGICDKFACKDSDDCNGNLCKDEICHCVSKMGGISCQFCTTPGQRDCKNICSTGSCQYGTACVYLTGNSGIWECSACMVGHIPPLCQDCFVGYIKHGDACLQKCEECHTGDCYFLEPCAQPAAQCNTKCVSCLPGISGERCDKCPVGQQFYEYSCYPLEDEKLTNGVCIKIESKTICFSCLADFILIDDQCIFQCLPTNCINGECQPDQSCLCKRYALGKHCDSCQSGTGSFMGQCLQICNGCNGDCYYDRGEIVCSSCNDNFQGPPCQGCWTGFINIGTECLEVCHKCQGDRCYITISGNFVCLGPCQAGYILDGCFTCDTSNGFVAALGGCFQQCTTCSQGTCFQTPSGIQCSSCSGSFTGQQCDVCLDGFVFAEGTCHTQVTDDECYIDGTGNMICLQCLAGKVLVDQQCLVKCVLPDCAGECYHKVPSYFCRSCYFGFIFHENKCYPPTSNPNGDCFVLQDRTLCSCYKGYAGPSCDECSELEKGGSCYYRNDVATGSCFSNADDSLDSFCQQCQYNYAMPLCLSCAMGYAMDSSGECNECQPGYTSSNSLPPSERAIIGDNRCLISCADCAQGNCFYAGESILCASCSPGYAISTNCLQCEDGFAEFGGYCLTSGTSSCGEDNSGDTYCTTCGPQQQSFNCSLCTVEGTFGSDCKQHATHFPGECYQTSSTVTCTDAPCLSFDIASNQCLICRSDLINIKGYCGTITLPQNDKLRGNCINVGTYQVCGTCQKGWSGNICSECDKGYIRCQCNTELFQHCCCPLLPLLNGVCFTTQLTSIICEYCGPRYELLQKQCVQQNISITKLVTIVLVPILTGFLLLIILVLLVKLFKVKRRQIFISVKRIIKRIGPHLVFVILSQALAIIIAIQDVYIGDFFMQISVNIFSMIPFILAFFFLAVPTYKQFFYNLPSHFFLFVLSALIELSFHFTQYIVVSEVVQNFGEQIYKLAGPLITLLMCICLAGFRFKSQQKLSVFIAVTVPLISQIMYAILDSEQSGYFSESSIWNIISGQMMVTIAILLNGVQFYLFDLILGKYGEIEAIGRLALASFMVNSMIGLTNPGEIINSILQYDIFFSSLCTQIFFNFINIIIMMHISAVEFGINLISSAIWAQFISAVGEFYIASNNSYNISLISLILQSLSLVIVFVSLLYFNIRSSYWDHRNNDKLSKESIAITGVNEFIKSRRQYKQLFKKMQQNKLHDNLSQVTHNQVLKDMQSKLNQMNQPYNQTTLRQNTGSCFMQDIVKQKSSRQVYYLKNNDTLITKLPQKQNNKTVGQLQLASDQICQSQDLSFHSIHQYMDQNKFK